MISEAVRRLAEHSYRELPLPPSHEWIEQDGVVLVVTPYPTPQIVHPVELGVEDVDAAVEAMRAIGHDRGKTVLGWWVAPEHDALVPGLKALGLVNEDTGGYEAVENPMALVTPPPVVAGVEVRRVESFDEFAVAARVAMEAFETPAHLREELEAGLEQRFEESQDARNHGLDFIALIDGSTVGAASAVPANAGVALFGGSVLPAARGRGVYRALLRARWDLAVERGTPALTVQAGRMSKPILERLGFVQLSVVRLFFDHL